MNRAQQTTTGIILARTDYGEADRILTILTPDAGKLRLIAKGVRRIKSKLAGGIELFSTSDITFMRGRGDIGKVVSTRLIRFYGMITADIDRTMTGYDIIKQLDKATEDEPEPDYYHLLEQAFVALDDASIDLDLIRLWFAAQLLRLSGHTPNLQTEPDGTKLTADQTYEFSFDDSAFISRAGGTFTADSIKFLRILFNGNEPRLVRNVTGAGQLTSQSLPLVINLKQFHVHI